MLQGTHASQQEKSDVENPDVNQFHGTIIPADKQTVIATEEAQLVDIQRLITIVSKLDFNTVKSATPDNDVLDILQRLLPHIPQKNLAIVVNEISARIEENQKIISGVKQQSTSQNNTFFVKLFLSIATSLAGLYFGGPLAAKGTDVITSQIYTILFGAPDEKSLAYVVLSPCKKFVINIAAQYGGYAIGIIAGPTVYSLASIGEFLCKKVYFLGKLGHYAANKAHLCLPMAKKDPSTLPEIGMDDLIATFEVMNIALEEVPTLLPENLIIDGKSHLICHDYRGKKETPLSLTALAETRDPPQPQEKTTMSALFG